MRNLLFFRGSRVVFLSLFFVFLFAIHMALAAITVENQTGTVTITTPDGKVLTVEPGQPPPNIPSGSLIEIVTGHAGISAADGDSVDVLLNGSTATVKDGAKINVRIDLRTGSAVMEVLSGQVPVLQPDGTTSIVSEGSDISSEAPTPISPDTISPPGVNPAGDPSGAGYR